MLRYSLFSVCVLGCARGDTYTAGSNWRGTTETSGDTLKVHTLSGSILGDLGTVSAESLEIIYSGEGVQRSTVVAAAGVRLLIGEGTQIVVIHRDGSADTIGRRGDGPGEFRRIIGLRGNGDTVEALDGRTTRFTRIRSGGDPTTETVEAPEGYPSYLYASRLSACQGKMLLTWTKLATGRRNPDTVAVTWWSAETRSGPWLMIESESMTSLKTAAGVMYATRFPFGPQAMIASDGACWVAAADGVSYKILLKDAAADSVRIIEVDEVAPPVTSDARTIPEQWRGQWPAVDLSTTLDLMDVQEYGDRRNKLEALHIDAEGRLWARVVDTTYRFHPWVTDQVAEARPVSYRWDVFGTDGKRLAILNLPNNFSPKAWSGRWVYGIAEGEDGALVVGRLPIPKELE